MRKFLGAPLSAPAVEPATGRITPRQFLLAAGGVLLLILALWLVRKLLARLPLAPLMAAINAGWKTLQDLRKPALPQRLNPDSNAAE